jgi:hypothetical protein
MQYAACGRVFSKLLLQNSMEHEAMEGQYLNNGPTNDGHKR